MGSGLLKRNGLISRLVQELKFLSNMKITRGNFRETFCVWVWKTPAKFGSLQSVMKVLRSTKVWLVACYLHSERLRISLYVHIKEGNYNLRQWLIILFSSSKWLSSRGKISHEIYEYCSWYYVLKYSCFWKLSSNAIP